MKAWYSKVRDTELIDGSVRADYVVTFETDNFELKRKVEKYLQGIMDEAEQTEPSNSEKPNSYEDEFFREPTAEERKAIADYIDSISVPTGVNVFDLMDEPQTYITEDRDTQILDAWQVHHRTSTTAVEDEPQTDYDKGLQLFADIMFDKKKSEQFLKECKAMGIEPQTDFSWK